MGFFVRFWGTRGSIATPGAATRKYGGNTSCVEMEIDGQIFICDAGTGARELGLDLVQRKQGPLRLHVLFSHAHWDHIQGFPFFKPAYLPDSTLYLYRIADAEIDYFKLLSGQMESPYFPVEFADLSCRIEPRLLQSGRNIIDGVGLTYCEQPHPSKSFGYRFESGGHSVVYATDSELDLVLTNKDEAESDLSVARQVPRQLVDFASGADVLIADGQYADAEYPSKRGWGHPRATTTVDLAVQAGVKQLVIYHHDPMQNDAAVEEKVRKCSQRARLLGSDVEVVGAREGLTIAVAGG
jgi:phosphoribosyl 1,2-cyclic phosphodiesterase